MDVGRTVILDEDIRVLTVLPLWASLIASGRKNVENRPPRVAAFAKRCLIGKRLAIHAGWGIDRLALGYPTAPDGLPWPPTLTHGGVIALVTVDRVEAPDLDGPLEAWRHREQAGIYLRDVFRLPEPVPLIGGQGWRFLKRIDGGRPWAALAKQAERSTP